MAWPVYKKGVALGIVLLATIAGAFAYTRDNSRSKLPDLAVVTTPSGVIEIDTDEDGLKDWEETLWHSDPNKADTDNDGTKDGEEVLANRDPVKKGPNDQIISKVTLTDNTDSNTSSAFKYEFDKSLGKNMTETLADNLTVNYLNAKAKGSFDSATAKSIATKLAQEFSSAELYQNINENNLRIIPTTDTNIKNYLISSYRAITYKYTLVGAELSILNNALQSEDYSNLPDLETSIKNYQHSLSLLLAMSVPSSQVKAHITLAQAYDTLVRSLRTIMGAGEDTVLVIKEMGRYAKAMEQISLMYQRGQALATRYWSLTDLPDLP